MTPGAPGAPHFARPADAAAAITSCSAVVIAGEDGQHAAVIAAAIARAAAALGRRVALADLAGDAEPIYALAGGSDAPGLAECFRDDRPLGEIARPVAEVPGLFVLPSGVGVAAEPAIARVDRWERLIAGFHEADGLLVLAVPPRSPALPALGQAGALLLFAGPAESAPGGIRLAGTVGAVVYGARAHAPGRPAGAIAGWQVSVAAVATAVVAGTAGIVWTRAAHRPDGRVAISAAPVTTQPDTGAADAIPDTVTITERAATDDAAGAAPWIVQVVAATTATIANSALAEASEAPAATVSVISRQSGTNRVAWWHRASFGAWRDRRGADSALVEARRRDWMPEGEGVVVRAPFGLLLADSASAAQAAAVVEVWKAKGVVPYAMAQDDGTVRVYVGAFETVAQAVTMAALIRAAGAAPIVALRTGRPY